MHEQTDLKQFPLIGSDRVVTVDPANDLSSFKLAYFTRRRTSDLQNPITPNSKQVQDFIAEKISNESHPRSGFLHYRDLSVFSIGNKNGTSTFAFNQRVGLEHVPSQILDRNSKNSLEVAALFQALPDPTLKLGSLSVLKGLLSPPSTETGIWVKQQAVKELLEDQSKLKLVNRLLSQISALEEDLLSVFSVPHWLDQAYDTFIKQRHALRELSSTVSKLPEFQSDYLKALRVAATELTASDTFKLYDQGIVRTPTKICTPSEVNKSKFSHSLIPYPYTLKALALVCATAIPLSAATLINSVRQSSLDLSSGFLFAGLVVISSAFYIFKTKESVDTSSILRPLAYKAKQDEKLQEALGALGQLSELCCYAEFGLNTKYKSCFPTIVEHPHHCFVAHNLTSPLWSNSSGFVANDISFLGTSIKGLSGPNSAGKSSMVVSVGLSQLLALNGCPILADAACTSRCSAIRYQVVEQNSQSKNKGDTEGAGRLESQLDVTSQYLEIADAHSLIMLDDLADGTNASEQEIIAENCLRSTAATGASILVTSHNFNLIEKLTVAGLCEPATFIISNGLPTRRMTAGIATSSFAELVAHKAGVDMDSLKWKLVKDGLLQEPTE